MHTLPIPGPNTPDVPLLGQVVGGRYRVQALIARGSMGRIYRAHDLLLERSVVMKWLARPAARNDAALRLQREGRVLASLHSPFIVKVHDQGVHDDQPYLVMELVPGRPLSQVLERGCLEVRRAVRITRQLLRALSVLHTEGFVHRDLKPSNLMLQHLGSDGHEHLVLLDFGLVKHTRERRDEELTLPGTMVGTPLFIAPEILYGASPTPSADLFSVGVLLFQMLTGHPPFHGDTPARVLQAIMQDDPAPLRQVQPGLRPLDALQWIVDHCLAKDPAHRFRSVAELDRALALVQDHLDTGAPLPALFLRQGRTTIGPQRTPRSRLSCWRRRRG